MPEECPHHHEQAADEPVAPIAVDAPPRYWRSIDEWSRTPEFEQMLHREFPEASPQWKDGTSRRNFLKVMTASAALVGLNGCFRRPTEAIVPYVRPPEQVVPGVPLEFATAIGHDGFARGAIVRSSEGRPTKVEGNAAHPASLGSTDIFMQAAVLDLYDPDRTQVVNHEGSVSSWDAFALMLMGENFADGAGVRVLSTSSTSPTLARQKRDFLKRFPAARWHQYDAVGNEHARAGAVAAFGEVVEPIYQFDRAKIILSLDADFLLHGPAAIRYSRDFIDARRVRIKDGKTAMNRLYVVESSPTITGAMADHRSRVRPSEIQAIAEAILSRVGGTGGGKDTALPWIDSLVADLTSNRGASAVVAGPWQPSAVHAAAHALNDALGNAGKTVSFIDALTEAAAGGTTIQSLAADMAAGSVQKLIILDGNPAYDAPVELDFARLMDRVPLRIYHGMQDHETAALCHWQLPATHSFEHWSDLRSFDGTASVVQPLIAPLYQGRSVHQLLNLFVGRNDTSDYETVRETWKQFHAGGDFENFWRTALDRGVIAGTESKTRTPPLRLTAATTSPTTAPRSGDFELAIRPDASIYDGRFANNGWLQELPNPLTKLTWDNAIWMSPDAADHAGVKAGSMAELTCNGRTVRGPVLVVPGHPQGVLTVHLGYGRNRAGRVGTGVGFNAYAIRTSESPWHVDGVSLRKLDESHDLAIAQRHQSMEGRDLIRVLGISEYLKDKPGEAEKKALPLTLYPQYDYDRPGTHKWGMSIDNNACIGCNTCVIACVAENNIAVVGKEQVLNGREMHWLRIDAYYTGDIREGAGPFFEPVPCMHCEQAPCEVVCPVAATTHSAEGINEMTYNRCVGTRYCSNNCPYKVRHFNFLQYSDTTTESLKLGRNPDVTVRNRGVMEKCTYCIQRIDNGRIAAKVLDANGKPDEARKAIAAIHTACEQACPTHAISFGDLHLKELEVVKCKDEPGDYAMLEELNTRPRTTYLPRLVNSTVTG